MPPPRRMPSTTPLGQPADGSERSDAPVEAQRARRLVRAERGRVHGFGRHVVHGTHALRQRPVRGQGPCEAFGQFEKSNVKRRQHAHATHTHVCKLVRQAGHAQRLPGHTRTEIGDQAGPVGIQQDVLRLDVTVDNVMLVQVQHSRRHLVHPLLACGESMLDQRNRARQVAPDLQNL
jgi:hypothetical protein